MRGRFLFILLMLPFLLLTGCTRVIESPCDELKMYAWRGEWDNGNTAALSFEGNTARLDLHLQDEEHKLQGFCILTDDSFVICDIESEHNQCFGYRLHGDRVELIYNGSTIALQKVENG